MDCSPILHDRSTEPSPAQEYGLLQAFFPLSPPVAATVNLMVPRIGQNWSPSNSNGVDTEGRKKKKEK